MILFDQVIEISHLSQFAAFGDASFRFQFSKCFGIGGVFIHIDHARLARMRSRQGFEKEALGRLCISGRAEEEFQRVRMPVSSPIKIHPFLFHFDGGLINTPRVRHGLQMRATTPFQLWSILLNPAVNRRMIHMQPSLQHDFFQITVAERIPSIPPDA